MHLPVRLLAAAGAATLALGALTAVCAVPAAANPVGRHVPIGKLRHAGAPTPTTVRLRGWAADPDALTDNARVLGIVDGVRVGSTLTSVAMPIVSERYGTGPTPGFDLTVRVPATGEHTVCAAVRNVGPGVYRVLSCVVTPLGTRLSAGDLAAHDPFGHVGRPGASATAMSVRGWVREPDYPGPRTTVVLYVDGSPAATIRTTTADAAQLAAGSGPHGSFRFRVPVGPGAHVGCVWAVNIGLGDNALLGCTAADTRGPAGTGAVTEPAVNRTVVPTAKKQIGKPYVWGAAGPKTFDCSGLVVYSYTKAGFTGLPHQSGLQFNAARLIPASRAVPGDLVFYHDSEGTVYHVGVYLSRTNTVAAIDESQGVDYQAISTWNRPWATYGSFTHT